MLKFYDLPTAIDKKYIFKFFYYFLFTQYLTHLYNTMSFLIKDKNYIYEK